MTKIFKLGVFLLTSIFLASCGGSKPLPGQKEISSAEFLQKSVEKIEENPYDKCHVKGYNLISYNGKENRENIDTDLTFDPILRKYISYNDDYPNVQRADECYSTLMNAATELGFKESDFKFYSFDDGFRILSNASTIMDVEGVDTTINLYIDVIFNVYGWETYEKTEMTLKASAGGQSFTEKNCREIEATYSKSSN